MQAVTSARLPAPLPRRGLLTPWPGWSLVTAQSPWREGHDRGSDLERCSPALSASRGSLSSAQQGSILAPAR